MARLLIGAVAGGALGLIYQRFAGCAPGACPLTSHPIISTIYGAVLGALMASNLG